MTPNSSGALVKAESVVQIDWRNLLRWLETYRAPDGQTYFPAPGNGVGFGTIRVTAGVETGNQGDADLWLTDFRSSADTRIPLY